ncbi:MAG: bifunctional oligoribonuclease/PAP phosphatase NrnA [Oscillospiraceae bacterium]|nr:bifunctional oligoribonuclease/PAP phosphatase NrnA [Oscillospiraceae bacterium]
MSTMMTISDTAAWLSEHDNYLIFTHRRPDGDTIGCAGALAQGLREAGKTAFVFNNTETTRRYLRFVAGFLAPDDYDPDHVVFVDAASLNLFPKNSDKYTSAVSLCIDHHPSNTLYAQRTCLDGSFASCGEIIYEILMALSGSISAETAECLYAAVSTDTGCFAFSNTTANTLRVASLLINAGAPHREINKLLFRTKTRNRIKLEGALYSGFEYYFEGVVAISTITRDMIEIANVSEDDMDDIASLPGVVEGARVGITIREMSSPDGCKVSVRTSSPLVNAHAVCERFGGGGHPMAAGFTIDKPVSEVKEALLRTLREFL